MPPTSQITTFSSTNHPGGNKLQRQRMLEEHRHERHEGKGGAGGGQRTQRCPYPIAPTPALRPQSPTAASITPAMKCRRKLLGKNYYFGEQFTLISSPLIPSSSAEPLWVPSAEQGCHRCPSLL